MVQVTKGKNVVIETYDAKFKEFIATAAQTAFTMMSKAGETDPEYTRVFVDNIELASTDIIVSGANPRRGNYSGMHCMPGSADIYAKNQERRI